MNDRLIKLKVPIQLIVKTLIVFTLLLCQPIFAQTKPKVLLLHSYHPSYKWTHDLNSGITSIFNDLTKIDLHVEYMDSKKFSDSSHIALLTKMYRNKYSNISFDLIISSDDNALKFLKTYNATLFKNAPVVFSGINYLDKTSLINFPHFTGVNEHADIKENYDLILKLHPNTKNIYTVIDTLATGQKVKKQIDKIINDYPQKHINFHFITDVSFNEFTETIKHLPKESIILFTIFSKTKDNKFLEYYEAVQLIRSHSTLPIYGLWDFTLGHGIIGGFLTSGYYQGRTAALMGQQILAGIPVQDIPIVEQSPNKYMFDYEQVSKFNIKLKKLPTNSIFINKPITFIDLYFKEIITIIIIFIMLIVFIIILLININKRMKAEEKINKQLVFQQNLIDNVNTPIYYKNTKKEYIGCNKAFEELHGCKKSDILNKTTTNLSHQNDMDYYNNKDDELLNSQELQEYEGMLTLKNGVKKDLVFYKNVFYDNGHISGLVGAIFDITERKSLHYELKRLLASFDKNVIASKTDENGVLTYVSEAFCHISGYSQDELIGKTHAILRDKQTHDNVYQDLWHTLKSKKIWTGEITDRNKNGDSYTLKNIITPEYDKNGTFLNYISISQDITAQKHIEQANIKIENLNDEITDTQKEILFRLGAIAEARSQETGMHVKRVAEYSKLLATFYGLPEDEVEIIKMASPMHDIGKIAIPDSILNKPGKYNADEFEIMKTHAQIGYDMLKDSNKTILKSAAIIAHQHQEKYDGSGYPQQLKGSDIHIYGRITAVADVFDALGSSRVYKKAWPDEEIFKFFKVQSGQHFDPTLVDIFFTHIDDFLHIRDTFKDKS